MSGVPPFGGQSPPPAHAGVGSHRTTSAPPAHSVPGVAVSAGMPMPGGAPSFIPSPMTFGQFPPTSSGMGMMPWSYGVPPGQPQYTSPTRTVDQVRSNVGSAVQRTRTRRVAVLEDDDGTILNQEEVEGAAQASAPATISPEPTPAVEAPAAAPDSGTPAPTPEAGGGAPSPVAPTTEPASQQKDTPVPSTGPSEPVPTSEPVEKPADSPTPSKDEPRKATVYMSPVDRLLEPLEAYEEWQPPVALVHGEDKLPEAPAGGPVYSVEWMNKLEPVRQTLWYAGLKPFKVVVPEPVPTAKSQHGGFGTRRRAPAGSSSRDKGPSGKSGKDFMALRDPTVLLHSAGEASYTHQMARAKSHQEELKEEVTSILNKLARDTFDRLSNQILTVDITSMQELVDVVGIVYDKAVEFQKFQDLFADLCLKLTKSAAAWTQGKDGRHTFGISFQAEDGKWYADLSGEKRPQVTDEGSTERRAHVFGPFSTMEAAEQDMTRRCSFMRILLNRAQAEFSKEVTYDDLEEAEAKDKAAEAEMIAAGKLTDKEADAFQTRRDERQLEGMVRRRKVLSNISFIGELYKVNIAKAMIIDFCVLKLLHHGENLHPDVVDETDALAFCNLMAVVGAKLEEEEKASAAAEPAKREAMLKGRRLTLSDMLGFLQALYEEKAHGSTVRFRALDVKEAAEKGWTFRDGHVAKTSRTMTKEEFHKAEQEKAMAKKVAALKQRGARGASGSAWDGRRGGRFDRNQDVRVASDATGTSRHASRAGGRRSGRPQGRPGGVGRSPQAASPKATAAAAAAGAASEALEGDALVLRVASFFTDFGSNLRSEHRQASLQELEDTPAGKELVTSLQEIQASTGRGEALISEAFKVAKDAKDAQAREDAALLLSLAWAKDAITQDDVVSGLATHLAGYKDFKAYDLPKVDVYLGVLFAPVINNGSMHVATLVRLCSIGTAFFAGSGLALLGTMLVEAAKVKEDGPPVTIPHDVSLMPLAGPCTFDTRGFTKNMAAALQCDAIASHPDAAHLQALLAWRQESDRKGAEDIAAAWSTHLSGASAPAAASALLQLVGDAGNAGMGGNAGAADVEQLHKVQGAVKTIADAGRAAGAEEFAAFLLEGTGRYCQLEDMYTADARPAVIGAFTAYFLEQGIVTKEEATKWKTAKTGAFLSADHATIVKAARAAISKA